MKTIKTRSHERGFVLIAVYLVISVIAIFSIVFFARHNAFTQATERSRNKVIAFNMAESGVDWALAQLSTDPTYTGTAAYVPLDTPFANSGFTVVVTTAADNDLIRIIQSTGFAPDNDPTSRAYQSANITTYGEYQPSNLFEFAVFAEEEIELKGNALVDSYDSRLGPYDAATAGTEGDVAVNNSDDSSITLDGNTVVSGDVFIGPGGDPDTGIVVGPNATITGSSAESTNTQVYTEPSTTLPSSGDLEVDGNTIYPLLPGTYHFSSLSISGNGSINATGPVEIYVSGDVAIAGNGFATQGNLPSNLLIYVIGDGDVSFHGNAAFYGGVYAPEAEIENEGNGSIYGAVVAGEYSQVGNGAVHFDEALKDVSGSDQSTMALTAWQEQNTLAWGTGS